MIIDIITSQVKHTGDLDLNAPLWVPDNGEEIYVPCSHHLMGELYSHGIYKYIFIEQTSLGFIERTMISFDELDPTTMALLGNPSVSVDLFPVCNKVIDTNTNTCHVTGFINPIKQVLKELTGTRPDSLQSIHQSVIHAMYNYLGSASLSMTNALMRFCEENHNQLKHTVNLNREMTSDILTTRGYVRSLLHTIDWEKGYIGDILSIAIGLPHQITLDWVTDKPFIPSTQLKPLIANGVGLTHGTYVDTKPAVDLLQSTLPQEKRWVGINLTEVLNSISVSEFSITFTTTGPEIHYSKSFDKRLVITPDQLVLIENAIRPIWRPNITVQKTIGNDVWVYTDEVTYHFDLILYNLCTANIVDTALPSIL